MSIQRIPTAQLFAEMSVLLQVKFCFLNTALETHPDPKTVSTKVVTVMQHTFRASGARVPVPFFLSPRECFHDAKSNTLTSLTPPQSTLQVAAFTFLFLPSQLMTTRCQAFRMGSRTDMNWLLICRELPSSDLLLHSLIASCWVN